MLKSYFKTAFRNLAKNKVFSLINVAGLSIGISSALVIYLIVSYDFSFDKFEKDGIGFIALFPISLFLVKPIITPVLLTRWVVQ